MRLCRLGAAVLVLVFLIPSSVLAQEPPSQPDEGDECRAGELCGSGTREDRFQNDTRVDAPDPPGNYVRSLITLGLIAAVIGTYLFIALSGRSLRRRGSAARAR